MKNKDKERRINRRNPIRVLVNCLPPGTPARRNGHETHGWEMWARNIGENGVGLQWTREWAAARCPHCLGTLAGRVRERERETCQCLPPHEKLKLGKHVLLDGLIYSDKGSRPVRGRIQWIHAAKNGRTYEFGVQITSSDHRSFFRTLSAI